MKPEMLNKIPWKKVGKYVAYGVAAAAAAVSAIGDKKQEETIEQLVEEVSKLKGEKS